MANDFDEKFEKAIGMTPDYFRYKFEESLGRIANIEEMIREFSPLIGASMIKLEAIKNLLADKGYMKNGEIDKELLKVASEANALKYLKKEEH